MEVLSPMEKKLLLELEKHGGEAKPEEIDMELVKIMNAASWLQSKKIVGIKEKLIKEYEITEEGKKFLEYGLPEKKLLSMDNVTIDEIEEKFGKKDAKIMIGWALNKKWCNILKKDGKKYIIITNEGRLLSPFWKYRFWYSKDVLKGNMLEMWRQLISKRKGKNETGYTKS